MKVIVSGASGLIGKGLIAGPDLNSGFNVTISDFKGHFFFHVFSKSLNNPRVRYLISTFSLLYFASVTIPSIFIPIFLLTFNIATNRT